MPNFISNVDSRGWWGKGRLKRPGKSQTREEMRRNGDERATTVSGNEKGEEREGEGRAEERKREARMQKVKWVLWIKRFAPQILAQSKHDRYSVQLSDRRHALRHDDLVLCSRWYINPTSVASRVASSLHQSAKKRVQGSSARPECW